MNCFPFKRCHVCGSMFVRWSKPPRFADEFQYWCCRDCPAVWAEQNGVLASEMKIPVATPDGDPVNSPA